MSNNKNQDTFGRDEMTAFLGGGLSETLLRAPSSAQTTNKSNSHKSSGAGVGTKGPDVASMTTQETAAYLLNQQHAKAAGEGNAATAKKAAVAPHRRANKVRQYHLLAQEVAAEQRNAPTNTKMTSLPAPSIATTQRHEDDDDSSSGNEFESMRVRRQKRLATATSQKGPVSSGRRRRADSSSDSDSDTPASALVSRRRHRRAEASSSDDDDDDSSTDQRRQRILQQRKQQQGAQKQQAELRSEAQTSIDAIPANSTVLTTKLESRRVESQSDLKATQQQSFSSPSKEQSPPPAVKSSSRRSRPDSSSSQSSGGSDSSSGSSSSGSDDSSSSSEEEDDAPALKIHKPVFIPKHKRGLAQSAQQEEEQEAKRLEKEEHIKARRKQESRALVQQVVTSVQKDASMAAGEGENADIPDDDDTLDKDAWEVRELLRLLQDWEKEQERIQEERDLARRRKMTEDEKLQEDIRTGRYQQPGRKKDTAGGRSSQSESNNEQRGRYVHRGAFYMDEKEWDESDVRHKAAEYAQAATEADKTRAEMPDIMKKSKAGQFGRANQNLRYQGLNAEDTTDRSMKVLPLPQLNKKRK